jgi:hypothetical protein
MVPANSDSRLPQEITDLYNDPVIHIGTFRLPGMMPHFDRWRIVLGNLMVFPRTSVRIFYAGWEDVVADPNVVMFYNKGQEYRREKISDRGDLCEWFHFSDDVLANALKRYD